MRISKEDYYIGIACSVAQRSTCRRRMFGAVIVKNDMIVATGYNGAPRGILNCCDNDACMRDVMNVPRGTQYELCLGVHAEQNAIIHAGREKCLGATLYLVGFEANGMPVKDIQPCVICKRMIMNAGIGMVVVPSSEKVKFIDPSLWTSRDLIGGY